MATARVEVPEDEIPEPPEPLPSVGRALVLWEEARDNQHRLRRGLASLKAELKLADAELEMAAVNLALANRVKGP